MINVAFLRTFGPAVLGLALAVGAYFYGRDVGMERSEERHRAALAESIERAWEQSAEIAKQDAEVAAATLATERQIEVRYRTLIKEVPSYVTVEKGSQCPGLTTVGKRMLAAARAGLAAPGATTDTSQSGGKVPAPPAGRLSQGMDDAMHGQSWRDVPRSPVPDSAIARRL